MFKLGKVYVIVSVLGVPTGIISTITIKDIELLERISATGATVYERPLLKVRFAHIRG